jgi:hypothetical protein
VIPNLREVQTATLAQRKTKVDLDHSTGVQSASSRAPDGQKIGCTPC